MFGTRSISTREPATETGLRRAALVVCSYGGGSAIGRRVRSLGQALGFSETAAGSLFGAPRIEDAVATLSGSPILVVPLFMARGITHGTLEARLSALDCRDRIVLCPEFGRHPDLAARLSAHAIGELRRLGWRPEQTGLLLIAHGSRRNAASQETAERLAREIRRLAQFADASAGFLEEPPTVEEAVRASPARRLLAVGCFIESGRHATQDVPLRLARSGRPTVYSGPIGACDWIDSLVLDQAKEGLRRSAPQTAWLG